MKKYLYILSFCLLQCSLTGFAQSEDTSISDTITLPEVTISAERPYVQRKADRIIVGIEHSKLLKARSLSNILNLIPGISYDGEGGVTFMGNAVKIYENGRMLKLSGAQLKRFCLPCVAMTLRTWRYSLMRQPSMMPKEVRGFLSSTVAGGTSMGFPVTWAVNMRG